MRRREFLKLTGTAAAAGLAGQWAEVARAARLTCSEVSQLAVGHVLPTVSHERMRLKVSFPEPLRRHPPTLLVDGRRAGRRRTDSEGRFWWFEATRLEAGRTYTLELRIGDCPVMDPWPLSTLPHPDSLPSSFRLLQFTCPGGNDIISQGFGLPIYVPIPLRRRLLQRALSFQPDAVIVNGDHVYWDLRSLPSALITGNSEVGKAFAGEFDRAARILRHPNESVLKRAVDGQIVDLYGTLLKGTPTYFLRDDHDYFEDDRASDDLVTFPPDSFMHELARITQRFYYPEFLPDPNRPTLASGGRRHRPRGVNGSFGTLRYGRLVEALLYDCKGHMSLGADARLVPQDAEAWLLARMADPTLRHVVNVPSNPPGWSAGKYAEWYPDVVVDGELTAEVPKFGWQPGWLAQHDRLLAAAARMEGIPLFLSGDIHSIAEERILASGANDFGDNPVISVITGTPGTGLGWPSAARGIVATAPASLQVETVVPVEEINGFHLIDFTPDEVRIRHFRWSFIGGDPASAIDTLQPFHVSTYTR